MYPITRLIAITGLLVLVVCTALAPPQAAAATSNTMVPAQALSATPTRFALPDGQSLAGRAWITPSPQHIVLGVHGFNDYSKAFEPLAQHLASELQATVYAYDQRGFGANRQPGLWPGSDFLLADLRHIAGQLRAQHPGLPLTVVGESMGGALVLVAAGESPGLTADQIVLQAPAVWGAQSMPWYQRWGLQWLNAVAPDMSLTGRGAQSLGINPTDDPEVSRDLSRDPLFIKATRVSSLVGVTDLMGRAQNLTTLPPQRTLVLYGLRDRIIPPAPVCDWVTRLSTADNLPRSLEFLVYPQGWHLLTRQLRARDVLQDIGQWMVHSSAHQAHNPRAARPLVCDKL